MSQFKVMVITDRDITSSRSPRYLLQVVRWGRLHVDMNLKDYDKVVLDVRALDRPQVDWAIFRQILNPTVTVGILSGDESGIIVLGDCSFDIPRDEAEHRGYGSPLSPEVSFLTWVGGEPTWDRRAGDRVVHNPNFADSKLAAFGRRVTRFTNSLVEFDDEGAYEHRIRVEAVVSTRYQSAAVFALRFSDVYSPFVDLPGGVICLANGYDDSERLLWDVLRDFAGVDGRAAEPGWAQTLSVPGQLAIDAAIAQATADRDAALLAIEAAEQDRVAARQLLRLLYDQHKSLEVIVKDSFKELGAMVREPKVTNEAEFFVVAPSGAEAVAEVKSTTRDTVDKYGFLQVQSWVDQGELEEGKTYKALLIINTAVGKAPEKRPAPLPANLRDFAVARGIAVITTTQIFTAVVAAREGQLDVATFWALLFSTSGLFAP